MTIEQQKQIEKYKQEFAENCKDYAAYGSKRYCKFSLYKSENPEDANYTMVITNISGISDDYQPYVETLNLMVEPDGNTLQLTDIYEPSEVVTYIQQLKKIE